jgi:hypothetical protein
MPEATRSETQFTTSAYVTRSRRTVPHLGLTTVRFPCRHRKDALPQPPSDIAEAVAENDARKELVS